MKTRGTIICERLFVRLPNPDGRGHAWPVWHWFAYHEEDAERLRFHGKGPSSIDALSSLQLIDATRDRTEAMT